MSRSNSLNSHLGYIGIGDKAQKVGIVKGSHHPHFYTEVKKLDDEDFDDGSGSGDNSLRSSLNKPQSRKCLDSSIINILMVILPVPIAVMLGWLITPWAVHQYISYKMVLSPSTSPELYAAWLNPPPLFMNVYLFNVTNPSEVEKGELPQLVEVGPYVFQENLTKSEVTHDDPTDTVTYKQSIGFHFREDLTGVGRSLSDTLTVINVPFVAAAIKISQEFPWPIKDVAMGILVKYKEELFIRKTVEELLFKGWKVPFLEKIEEDVGLSFLANNTFAYFVGENGTAKGPYTVSRGTHDKSSFGTFVKVQNKSHLNTWGEDNTNYCNKIQGSDGSLFPPFVEKSTKLRLFNEGVCSTNFLTYDDSQSQGQVEHEGIKGYHFVVPPEAQEDPRKGGDNKCFCATVDDAPEKCFGQGVLDLGPCRDGAPVAISNAHFYNANSSFAEATGLVPDEGKHGTFIDIEPTSGVILRARIRGQLNLILKRVKRLKSLAKVPEILFPLFWADEYFELDPDHASMLRFNLFLAWLADLISKWGALLVALTLSFFFLYRNRKFLCQNDKMGKSANLSRNSDESTQVSLDSSYESATATR